LVISPKSKIYTMVEDENYASYPLGRAAQELHPRVIEISIHENITEDEFNQIIERAKRVDYILVGTVHAHQNLCQKQLVKQLHHLGKPMAVIAMRDPYDLTAFPEINVFLTTYEYTLPALQTAVEIVLGKRHARGKLPISLPGLYERGHGLVK
jgi:beta-N-acetylhexosaminidase